MKKRLLITFIAITVLLVACFSLTACSSLQDKEAFDIFREAYENSTGLKEGSQWGQIYYYQETIKQKASLDNGDGFQRDLSVNVNCEYDEKKGYNFDKNFAVSVTQNFKKESIDATEKTSMTDLGTNELYAALNKSKQPTLFVNKKVVENNKAETQKYIQNNVVAQDFANSSWFEQYTLKSKLSIFGDLAQNDIEFFDSKEAKNGKERVFMTTKLSFNIKQEYLDSHPEAAILDGNYVYVEIVDVDMSAKTDYRINNVYVYRTEKIGGMDMLKLDYESYILNISYMGPRINPIDTKDCEVKEDLFLGGMVNPNYLFKP